MELTDSQIEILEVIKQWTSLSYPEIQKNSGIKPYAIRKILVALRKDGLLTPTKLVNWRTGKKVNYYSLTPAGRAALATQRQRVY